VIVAVAVLMISTCTAAWCANSYHTQVVELETTHQAALQTELGKMLDLQAEHNALVSSLETAEGRLNRASDIQEALRVERDNAVSDFWELKPLYREAQAERDEYLIMYYYYYRAYYDMYIKLDDYMGDWENENATVLGVGLFYVAVEYHSDYPPESITITGNPSWNIVKSGSQVRWRETSYVVSSSSFEVNVSPCEWFEIFIYRLKT